MEVSKKASDEVDVWADIITDKMKMRKTSKS